MGTKLAALAVLTAAAAAVTVAAVAAAGPVAAPQQIAILEHNDSFVLTPLTAGAIKRDAGTRVSCCWTRRFIKQDGVSIEVNDPQLTFTGAHGTLVFHNRIEWGGLPDGWSVFTGSWKFVRGTGAYAGLSGRGRVAGVSTSETDGKARLWGVLGPR
jgi:hypothetical protein